MPYIGRYTRDADQLDGFTDVLRSVEGVAGRVAGAVQRVTGEVQQRAAQVNRVAQQVEGQIPNVEAIARNPGAAYTSAAVGARVAESSPIRTALVIGGVGLVVWGLSGVLGRKS